MRIFLKIVLFVIGAMLMLGGGFVAAVGYAHGDGNLRRPQLELPIYKREAARFARDAERALRRSPHTEFLQVKKRGVLFPLGGGGLIVAFIGLICILNAIFRLKPKEDEGIREDDTRIADDLVKGDIRPAAVQPKAAEAAEAEAEDGAKAEAEIAIDESMLDDEKQDPFEAMRDINNLVTMSQGNLDAEQCERVVKMFRPDLLPHLPLFNLESMGYLAHQILESVIFRHQRQKKNITADQFQQQDKRVHELEGETFVRRYMPPPEKINSDRMREHVGRVYDIMRQGEIQKEFLGEAEDWADVSLRNAADVLSLDAGSGAPRPAPAADGDSETS